MRRNDREITDNAVINNILDTCKVCRLAMISEGEPYIVPMNFGYERDENKLTLFFHCAPEGRKLDALHKNNSVCFEMDCDHAVVGKGDACNYSFAYASIIGTGHVEFLEETASKLHALKALMAHMTGRSFGWSFRAELVEQTCVFRLNVEEFTAKQHTAP